MSTSRSGAQAALEPAAYVELMVPIATLELHVQDYGVSGKAPILCVHGGAANAHWFDFVARGFHPDYHVRAVDLRGHGDSAWDNSPTPDYSYKCHAADLHELTEKGAALLPIIHEMSRFGHSRLVDDETHTHAHGGKRAVPAV